MILFIKIYKSNKINIFLSPMTLSSSLASLDLNKLSQEMEKLGINLKLALISIGGGINIKREKNISKIILSEKQSLRKKKSSDLLSQLRIK